jgi:hypothetical protein
MAPVSYAMVIYRGDSYAWQFKLWNEADHSALDLTGVTPKAEIRNKPGGPTITELTCSITLPNIIDATLSAALSHALRAGQSVWDLQLTYAGGAVTTVVNGPVVVIGDVTDST